MPVSVKLYALLPEPASVLDRKNQGKGAATAGEMCPHNQKFKDFVRRSVAKAGCAHQSQAKVGCFNRSQAKVGVSGVSQIQDYKHAEIQN